MTVESNLNNLSPEKREWLEGIDRAWDSFCRSNSYRMGIVFATKAVWNKSTHIVELLPDGTYKLLWKEGIRRSYQSPGVMLVIEHLADEEWDEEDGHKYERVECIMAEKYQQWRNSYLEAQANNS